MAKELPAPDQKPESATTTPSTKEGGFSMKKLLMFGVPIFLVQVVIIYFIATKFVFPQNASSAEKIEERTESVQDVPDQVFLVNDLIVNPAGTNGTRFLLTTIGIEVTSLEAKAELEKKDLQVRDALISILTSKGLEELARVDQRESIRAEITTKLGGLVTLGKLKNVYFGKFIIQ